MKYLDPDGREDFFITNQQSEDPNKFLNYATAVGFYLLGSGIVIETLVEDAATGGIGTVDDAASFSAAIVCFAYAKTLTIGGVSESPSPVLKNGLSSGTSAAAGSPNTNGNSNDNNDNEPKKDNHKLDNKTRLKDSDIEKRTNSSVHDVKDKIRSQYGKEMKESGMSKNFDLHEVDQKVILKSNIGDAQLNLNIPLEAFGVE